MADDLNEWVCSHYQRKDFPVYGESVVEHLAHCYVDHPAYLDGDWPEYNQRYIDATVFMHQHLDFAAGVQINDVDESLFRRITKGERDRKGNLLWLKKDGYRV